MVTELELNEFTGFYNIFKDLMYEGYSSFPRRLQRHFLTFDYSSQAMLKWYQMGLRKFLVAKDEDEIVGFLVGDNSYGGVAFISWLGITAANRDKGYGSELLRTYEDYVTEKKAHVIELFTFDHVKPFYEKHGFTEVGRREQGYYGQQNVIMNKTISDWNLENLPQIV